MAYIAIQSTSAIHAIIDVEYVQALKSGNVCNVLLSMFWHRVESV